MFFGLKRILFISILFSSTTSNAFVVNVLRWWAILLVAAYLIEDVSCRGVNLFKRFNMTQERFHNTGRPVIPWEEYLPFAPEEALDIDLTVPSTVRVSGDRESTRQDRNYEPTYVQLCETVHTQVELKKEGYEFKPSFYRKVLCKATAESTNLEREEALKTAISVGTNQKCALQQFTCVQHYKRMKFLRRNLQSDNCWEIGEINIESGCECMVSKSQYGDISKYY